MDWPEAEVVRFVSAEINYYGFEVSPEQTKQGISNWKLWLWLEKNGFDFAYVSLEAEIVQFHIDRRPFGMSLAGERRLLLTVRDLMRDILSLPPLDAAQRDRIMATVPIANRTHWAAVRRPYGSDIAPSPESDFSDVTAFTWDLLAQDRPDYLDLLRRIMRHDGTRPESFTDAYTINGSYELLLYPAQKLSLYNMVTHHYVTRTYDMFFAPGNLRFHDFIAARFMESIEAYLDGDAAGN